MDFHCEVVLLKSIFDWLKKHEEQPFIGQRKTIIYCRDDRHDSKKINLRSVQLGQIQEKVYLYHHHQPSTMFSWKMNWLVFYLFQNVFIEEAALFTPSELV